MAATLLNEMGLWNPDAIERQLAHMENNGVRRAYARGQYWEERVRMMQHWSDYLDQLRSGGDSSKPAERWQRRDGRLRPPRLAGAMITAGSGARWLGKHARPEHASSSPRAWLQAPRNQDRITEPKCPRH
jgi:hypothetical protein